MVPNSKSFLKKKQKKPFTYLLRHSQFTCFFIFLFVRFIIYLSLTPGFLCSMIPHFFSQNVYYDGKSDCEWNFELNVCFKKKNKKNRNKFDADEQDLPFAMALIKLDMVLETIVRKGTLPSETLFILKPLELALLHSTILFYKKIPAACV